MLSEASVNGVKDASPEKVNEFVQQIKDWDAAGEAELAPELSVLHEQSLYLERLGRVCKLQQAIAEALFDNDTAENHAIQKALYRQEFSTLLDNIIGAYGDYLEERGGVYKDGVLLSFKDNPRAKEEEQTRFSEKVTAEFQVYSQWSVPESRETALKSLEVAKRIAQKASDQLARLSDSHIALVSPLLETRQVYEKLIRPVSRDSLPSEQNIFYQLCIEGDLEGLQEKLIEIQFDKKDKKSAPMTPPWGRRSVQASKTFKTILEEQAPYALHNACAAGQLPIVRFLIENGIQQVPDSNGLYPFHYAVMDVSKVNEIDLLEHLKSMGANINQVTSNGQTPLDLAIFYQHDIFVSWLCLHDVAINGLRNGHKPCLQPPLHNAIKIDNARIVLLLLHNGANLFQKDKKGHSPLLAAFLNQSFASASVFFDKGIFFSGEDRQHLEQWIPKRPFGDPLAKLAQAMIDHNEKTVSSFMALIAEHVETVQGCSQPLNHREPEEWSDAENPVLVASAKRPMLLSSTGSSTASSTQSPLLQRRVEELAILEKGGSPSLSCGESLTPYFKRAQRQRRDKLTIQRVLSTPQEGCQDGTEYESAGSTTPSPDYVPRRRGKT